MQKQPEMTINTIQGEAGKSETRPSGLIAVSAIIVSAALMAFASGLAYTYLPVKLHALGFAPWVAASMTPAVALGGLAGCFATGPLLRLTGHARIFMLVYAMIVVSMLALALTSSPYAWLGARAGYGFGINAMFIVAQSWLHHAATDATRGRIITVFYVAYVLSLGAGSFVLGQSDISGNFVPILAAAAVAVAIAPVALTRLPQPEPPGPVSVSIAKVWSISPVGLAGMLAVGGLTMTFQGFTPIYLLESGRAKEEVGLVMLAMQIGLVFVQTPLGLLSDRIDRRLVLLIACAGAVAAAAAGLSLQGAIPLVALALLLAIWNGCNESLYSVSSALANDRADPKDYVLLSSTQMIAWSVSAFVVPLGATILIQYFPIASYMAMCGAIAGIFGLFVLVRLRSRGDAATSEREAFQTITAQVVHPGEYANPDAPKPPVPSGDNRD